MLGSTHLSLLGRSTSRTLGLASLEAVLESSGDVLEVTAAAGTDGLSPLGLLGPVVCTRRKPRLVTRIVDQDHRSRNAVWSWGSF